jgi:hypothetical protein
MGTSLLLLGFAFVASSTSFASTCWRGLYSRGWQHGRGHRKGPQRLSEPFRLVRVRHEWRSCSPVAEEEGNVARLLYPEFRP